MEYSITPKTGTDSHHYREKPSVFGESFACKPQQFEVGLKFGPFSPARYDLGPWERTCVLTSDVHTVTRDYHRVKSYPGRPVSDRRLSQQVCSCRFVASLVDRRFSKE
eukprot:1185597-Prorocentrum_minimum.AAC.3